MTSDCLIRNFCIIAHIDHGKSTLADRFLELTGAVDRRNFHEQMLDGMELERERGITIKAKAVRLQFTSASGQNYIFNLIDTPGHVDFAYEVAKSLGACEGALLLIDASQGVEAQTVANFHLAKEAGLYIIPVVNKIDLPGADMERTAKQLHDIFGIVHDQVSFISAKEGTGVLEVLERITREIPPPSRNQQEPLRGFLFDSSFDPYKGVILYVRVFEGELTRGLAVTMIERGKSYLVEDVGVFKPKAELVEKLGAGEVGFISCSIRDPQEVSIPDAITETKRPTAQKIFSYKKIPPMVFCGIFPVAVSDYPVLKDAIEKLRLSDPSFVHEPDNLGILGYGFRCGFLGLLHMEIIRQRLEREYGMDLVLTSPNVRYEVTTKKNEVLIVETPYKFPLPEQIAEVREPYVLATIVTPLEYMDSLYELAKSRRGIYQKTDYLGEDRLAIIFEMPLAEVIIDFYDKIKTYTKGYGSLDYEFIGYRVSDVVKVEILLNHRPSGIFALLVHREKAEQRSRQFVAKLREFIPRHMFEVSIQAAIGSKIIASERISALKKDVTSKCYGGDITRKRKLWERQKEGKKKMKQLGEVEVPQQAFFEVLKI